MGWAGEALGTGSLRKVSPRPSKMTGGRSRTRTWQRLCLEERLHPITFARTCVLVGVGGHSLPRASREGPGGEILILPFSAGYPQRTNPITCQRAKRNFVAVVQIARLQGRGGGRAWGGWGRHSRVEKPGQWICRGPWKVFCTDDPQAKKVEIPQKQIKKSRMARLVIFTQRPS